MSFRNLTPTYLSALDSGQLGIHIMAMEITYNGGSGYIDTTTGPYTQYNYVEYIAGENGTNIQCPTVATATNTSGQFHKRYFPNVKYWSSFMNMSHIEPYAGYASFEIEVQAQSLVGDNFSADRVYTPASNNYFELLPSDNIYGKFNKIAIYEPVTVDNKATLILTVGEYK